MSILLQLYLAFSGWPESWNEIRQTKFSGEVSGFLNSDLADMSNHLNLLGPRIQIESNF